MNETTREQDELIVTIFNETKASLAQAYALADALFDAYRAANPEAHFGATPDDDDNATMLQALTEMRDHYRAETHIVLQDNEWGTKIGELAADDDIDVAVYAATTLSLPAAQKVALHFRYIRRLATGRSAHASLDRDDAAAIIAGIRVMAIIP